MEVSTENEILAAEDALSQAMLDSNVAQLDRLLADELIFTNHLGQCLGKQDDLQAHRSGLLHIDRIETQERQVKLLQGDAMVFAKVAIFGTYAGEPANGTFRFTRVWQRKDNHDWQVVAAHSSLVVS